MSDQMINGVDVAGTVAFREAVRADSSRADRHPTVVARWLGGSRAEVRCEDGVAHIGGDGELNAMRMLLGCLAACDIDLVALHASLLGIAIEDLVVEAQGRFNVRRYLGLEGDVGPGYQDVRYVVRINAPTASDEQLALLRTACERGSPVGDTLERAIPLTLEFERGPA
jgi:uncharacterized OsmC-like protein